MKLQEDRRRFDEQIKLHEEQEFDAEQRHIETMNELRLDHAYTVATIEEHSKSNLNNTTKLQMYYKSD